MCVRTERLEQKMRWREVQGREKGRSRKEVKGGDMWRVLRGWKAKQRMGMEGSKQRCT